MFIDRTASRKKAISSDGFRSLELSGAVVKAARARESGPFVKYASEILEDVRRRRSFQGRMRKIGRLHFCKPVLRYGRSVLSAGP
ncbi:hypothetical protein KC357_g78 [Hortaea werneckii]|nr:hypothetical protein KC357_g78 [Hortaea werneckii]